MNQPGNRGLTLIGVMLRYCDNGGNTHDKWVDMAEVGAFAWRTEEIDRKPQGQTGNRPVPETKTVPVCTERSRKDVVVDDDDGDMCWWDGSRWMCGPE